MSLVTAQGTYKIQLATKYDEVVKLGNETKPYYSKYEACLSVEQEKINNEYKQAEEEYTKFSSYFNA
ncbi:MAG: hypothetical protein LBD88_00400 [Candidatus Peribacteria bacterium]|jgi:hypothetical protein|nr:hypothetical protein [Candidatus Peribacteria bacterium]